MSNPSMIMYMNGTVWAPRSPNHKETDCGPLWVLPRRCADCDPAFLRWAKYIEICSIGRRRLALLPTCRSCRMSNLRALLSSETSRPRLAAFAAAFGAVRELAGHLSFPRRDSHDMDGIADHVGGE